MLSLTIQIPQFHINGAVIPRGVPRDPADSVTYSESFASFVFVCGKNVPQDRYVLVKLRCMRSPVLDGSSRTRLVKKQSHEDEKRVHSVCAYYTDLPKVTQWYVVDRSLCTSTNRSFLIGCQRL